MLTLPFELTTLIVAFAPLFSKTVFKHLQVLIGGAILAPGKRTVTQALRVCGLSADEHFQNYHCVLNRAVWSSLAASRTASNLNSRVNFLFGSAMNTSLPEHSIGHYLGVHQTGSGSTP